MTVIDIYFNSGRFLKGVTTPRDPVKMAEEVSSHETLLVEHQGGKTLIWLVNVDYIEFKEK